MVKPPAFSPPRYAVWVNSLWSLALLLSLTSAMLVTLEQRGALQYLILTQNKEYSPETRARFRAKVADEYGSITSEDGTPFRLFCLHLSFFLFATGFLVYFFNINRATFDVVVWWIAMITVLYAIISAAPIYGAFLFNITPFSPVVVRVYLDVIFLMVQIFHWIMPHGLFIKIAKHHGDLSDRCRVGIAEGNAKLLEEEASKPSSEIDSEVLERILLGLDEDHALETFFDAVPGFCGSKLVQPLCSRVTTKLQQSLDGFLDRTFSSHLVPGSVRNDRVIICLDAAHSALGATGVSQILGSFFDGHRDEALKSVEIGTLWSAGVTAVMI